jgi:hypothetical protein
VLGNSLGEEDGPDEGASLGAEVGVELGVEVGSVVGVPLGMLLGAELGNTLGAVLGSEDAICGSSQTLRCVMAIGPGKVTSIRTTDWTFNCTFLYGAGLALKVCVLLSSVVTRIQTSATTLRRPMSNTSFIGGEKAKEIIPPSSFAFHWAFPPVCCTINTLPNSPARPGVP